MVTITRHVFINIFQIDHISAVKFDTDYGGKYEVFFFFFFFFFVIPKSPSLLQKFEKIGLGSFNDH